MKKTIIGIIVLVGLAVAYWLISPLFITRRVDESVGDIMKPTGTPGASVAPTAQPPQTLRQGTFSGLLGHSGQGTAKLLKAGNQYFVRLEDDFKVTNGPDLYVYFGKDGQYVAEARLGALKGNEGGQNYEVPAGIDPADYNEVWIWCRAFSVAFAKAVLQ